MNQHETATQFTYHVREIAAAWRDHAQRHGITDPETQLVAQRAVSTSPRAGYRPAFFVPSTGELVTIVAQEPHRTQEEAISWLRWMLEQLHHNGNITLFRREDAACA